MRSFDHLASHVRVRSQVRRVSQLFRGPNVPYITPSDRTARLDYD